MNINEFCGSPLLMASCTIQNSILMTVMKIIIIIIIIIIIVTNLKQITFSILLNDYTFYFPARRRITITLTRRVQKVSQKVKRLRHLRIPKTMQYLALVNKLVFDFYILTNPTLRRFKCRTFHEPNSTDTYSIHEGYMYTMN